MNDVSNIISRESEPLWTQRLREECAKTSQAKVAKVIHYSSTAVNQVLKGKYPGDMQAFEKAVRGAYLGETINCPILGELETNICQHHKRQPYANTNSTRVALYRACNRTCPHNNESGGDA